MTLSVLNVISEEYLIQFCSNIELTKTNGNFVHHTQSNCSERNLYNFESYEKYTINNFTLNFSTRPLKVVSRKFQHPVNVSENQKMRYSPKTVINITRQYKDTKQQ